MTTVSARVYRNEPGEGSCLISSGFPVPPGLVPASLVPARKIKVYVDGVEVAANVSALRGTHTDGSLRSVLIQFRRVMTQGESVAAEVVFNEGVRAVDDIAYTRPNYHIAIECNNVILPEGAEYLCSTLLTFRKLLPVGLGSARDEKLYTQLAESRFDYCNPDKFGDASYEQVLGKLALWCRQGSGVKYWNASLVELARWLPYMQPNPNPDDPTLDVPCRANVVANPDGRPTTDCGTLNEWSAPRTYSFAAAYLMTGYRDFWGYVAYILSANISIRPTGEDWTYISTQDQANTAIVPYHKYGRNRYNSLNRYRALIPALMIDATIPVDGAYFTGFPVPDWDFQLEAVVNAMLHHAWDIRWVPFSSGMGTVPANGTIITQGASSATLYGVWSPRNKPKIEPPLAMPTEGWIMLTALSGPFSAGALSGISAIATGPDEDDYRNGIVGTRANSPLTVGAEKRGYRVEFQIYQSIFPTNFLIDYYLYVKTDARIPDMVKNTIDAVLVNLRPTVPGDPYHGKGDSLFGFVTWGGPYLWENPIDADENTPWSLPSYVRMIAFVLKTIGDYVVAGKMLSEWYNICVDTANINPKSVLTWTWKNFGQYYGWQMDVPWIMAQESVLNTGPSATKQPVMYTSIPDDGIDPIVPDPVDPEDPIVPDPEEPVDPTDPITPTPTTSGSILRTGSSLLRVGDGVLRVW